MKPQDVVFIIFLAVLVLARRHNWFVYTGLILLFLSIPLFSFWIFFTAQRFVWYAAAFIFLDIIYKLYQIRKLK